MTRIILPFVLMMLFTTTVFADAEGDARDAKDAALEARGVAADHESVATNSKDDAVTALGSANAVRPRQTNADLLASGDSERTAGNADFGNGFTVKLAAGDALKSNGDGLLVEGANAFTANNFVLAKEKFDEALEAFSSAGVEYQYADCYFIDAGGHYAGAITWYGQ